jgi:hypothetical protein
MARLPIYPDLESVLQVLLAGLQPQLVLGNGGPHPPQPLVQAGQAGGATKALGNQTGLVIAPVAQSFRMQGNGHHLQSAWGRELGGMLSLPLLAQLLSQDVGNFRATTIF